MAKDLAARTVLAAASTILEEFASYVQARYKTQQLRVEGLAAQGSRVDCGFCHPERPRAE
jgi:hypothetical protein